MKTGGSFPPSGLGRGDGLVEDAGPDELDACFSYASAGLRRWGSFPLIGERRFQPEIGATPGRPGVPAGIGTSTQEVRI